MFTQFTGFIHMESRLKRNECEVVNMVRDFTGKLFYSYYLQHTQPMKIKGRVVEGVKC